MNSNLKKEKNKDIIKIIRNLTLILIFDISIRHILEILLIDTKTDYSTIGKNLIDNILFYYENLSYFILSFLVITFVIALLTKNNIIKIMLLSSKLYIFVILPPILDKYVFYNWSKTKEYTSQFIDVGYKYASSNNLLHNILTLSFGTGDTSYGISLLVLIGFIGTGLYVFIQTKNIFKSLFIMIFFIIFIGVISTPSLIFPNNISYFYPELLLSWYFLPISIIIFIISKYYKVNKETQKIINYVMYIVMLSNVYYIFYLLFNDGCETCSSIYKQGLIIFVFMLLYIIKYFNHIPNKETRQILFLYLIYLMFGYVILHI